MRTWNTLRPEWPQTGPVPGRRAAAARGEQGVTSGSAARDKTQELPLVEMALGLLLVVTGLKFGAHGGSLVRTALLFGICAMITVYGYMRNPYAPLLCYAFVCPISAAFGTAFALILGGLLLVLLKSETCQWKWQFSGAGLAFCLWSLASLMWAEQIFTDLDSYIANALAPMFMAFIICGLRDTAFRRNLMLMVVAACVIGSVFSFRNWSKGIGEMGSGGRFYSLLPPDHFSAWSLFGIFSAIAWLVAGAPARWLRWTLMAILPVLVMGLGLCGYRAAILATVLGVMVVGFCQKRAGRFLGLVALGAVPVLALIALVPGIFGTLIARFEHIGQDRGSGRLDIWEGALNIFGQHPFAGVGLDNFKVAISRYYGQEMLPHSIYIGTLTELGLIGLVLMLLWLVVLLRKAWRTPERIWVFPLLVVYLFQAAFLHEFYFSCFWLAIALVEGARPLMARAEPPRAGTRRFMQRGSVAVPR